MAATSPLQDQHRQAEAEFQPYGQITIVSTFGEPPAEYASVRKATGLMDLAHRAILEVTGKDRLSFLNNLLTNQTWDKQTKSGLEPGRGVYAYLLHAKTGRILTDLHVLQRGDKALLEMDHRMIPSVRQQLERYLFAEQVRIVDQSDSLYEIALHGPGSAQVLGSLGALVAGMAIDDSMSARLLEFEVTIWRDDPAGVPGYFILMARDAAPSIWAKLLEQCGHSERTGHRALRPIGWAVFNTTRIEAGTALFGIDFDETTLPHETGLLLDRAVNFTKGCYPGQEIVARMHARKQVARKIVGLRMENGHLPIAGAKVLDESDNEIGAVTSSTISPILSRASIALAMVKRPHFNVGARLRIPAEGAMRGATVVELPFYGGGATR